MPPVETCTHRTPHQHGTNAAYTIDRCRCDLCRQARNRTEQARRQRVAVEQWHPDRALLVDAEPARQHIRTLLIHGMGIRSIATAVGTEKARIGELLYGCYPDNPTHPDHRPPRRRIRRAFAEKILSVTLQLADGAMIDDTGSARRLQALISPGWSGVRLADKLKIQRRNLQDAIDGGGLITVKFARRIRELYDTLQNTRPPEATPVEKRSASRSRNLARRKGWSLPIAWDDDTIDDPNSEPWRDTGKHTKGPHPRVQLEDVEWMLADGATLIQVATRLHATPESVERALYRAGRHDLVHRLKAAG